ncbi:MAG: FtsW/RodA/SpoVE family cell cycle protein [Caldisericaceae bacterium]|nr:FtsW/RodA/SpoVE family cell cycle protein [Caldisericaceae bacterium]
MTRAQKAYIVSIVFITYLLVFVGVVINISMSPVANPSRPMNSFYRYLLSIGIGSLLLLFFSFFNHKKLKKIAFPVLVLIFISLFFTVKVEGSYRWIYIKGIPFAIQPSQYIAPFLIVFIAKIFSEKTDDKDTVDLEIFSLFLMSVFAGKVALQPDFGTAFIIFLTVILLLIPLVRKYKILGGFSSILLLFSGIYVRRHPHLYGRIASFLHPERYSQEDSYQLLQSLRAIARGGIYGVGLMNSYFKYGGLPLNRLDFVFSIICEEFGLMGATVVLVIFFIFIYIGFRIVKLVPDTYSKILALGITIHIAVSVSVNIAVNVGLLPVTGVPLPIVGYSGNNAVVTFSEIGVLINIAKEAVE